MGFLIVAEALLVLAICWGIRHEDRLVALERYYARKISRTKKMITEHWHVQ